MGKCESSRGNVNEGNLIPGACAGEQFLWDVETRGLKQVTRREASWERKGCDAFSPEPHAH